MKKNRFLLLILFFIVAAIGTVTAQDIPERPVPPRLVNDFAGLLSIEQRDKLEDKLVYYYDTTSTQIAIILVKTIGNWEIAEFSYTLGDRWGVGIGSVDNGIVITIAEKERETFIATGRGIEGAIPDIYAHRIVNNVMIPEFSKGDFYSGLDDATDVIISLLQGEFSPVPYIYDDNFDNSFPTGAIIFLMIIIIFIIVVAKNADTRSGGSIGRGGWHGPIITGSSGYSGRNYSSGRSSSSSSGGRSFGGFGGGSFGGGGAGGKW